MVKGSCLCGSVTWTFDAEPESATACNCSACRRYGVLWIYDFEHEGIHVDGPTRAYVRKNGTLGFHFCPDCGCVTHWRSLQTDQDGRRRVAVNVRLSEPETVEHLLIDHFDGLDTFDDLPRDGRCVKDYWF